MKYMHYQFKANESESIVVNINEESDYAKSKLYLLDTGNYYKYRLGKGFEFLSEQFGAPKVIFEPPYKSEWHIIIELNTAGEIKTFVEIKPRGSEFI